jgi:hypothetical protein
MNAFSQSVSSSSSEQVNNTQQTLLCITHNDPTVVDKVRTTMTSMAGTNVVAYCDNHAIFMVEIDKGTYADTDAFLTQVKKYTPDVAMLLTLKQGDFSVIQKQCQSSNKTDASKLKSTLTN